MKQSGISWNKGDDGGKEMHHCPGFLFYVDGNNFRKNGNPLLLARMASLRLCKRISG